MKPEANEHLAQGGSSYTSYLVTLLNVSLQIENVFFFLIQYILFIIAIILLHKKLNRNIKLRRLLRNNETINKHYQPES